MNCLHIFFLLANISSLRNGLFGSGLSKHTGSGAAAEGTNNTYEMCFGGLAQPFNFKWTVREYVNGCGCTHTRHVYHFVISPSTQSINYVCANVNIFDLFSFCVLRFVAEASLLPLPLPACCFVSFYSKSNKCHSLDGFSEWIEMNHCCRHAWVCECVGSCDCMKMSRSEIFRGDSASAVVNAKENWISSIRLHVYWMLLLQRHCGLTLRIRAVSSIQRHAEKPIFSFEYIWFFLVVPTCVFGIFIVCGAFAVAATFVFLLNTHHKYGARQNRCAMLHICGCRQSIDIVDYMREHASVPQKVELIIYFVQIWICICERNGWLFHSLDTKYINIVFITMCTHWIRLIFFCRAIHCLMLLGVALVSWMICFIQIHSSINT